MTSKYLLVMLLDERINMREHYWYNIAIQEFNVILKLFKTEKNTSTRVVFIKFNTQPTVVLDCVNINDVPLLSNENYNPGNGKTPFYDSLKYAINLAENVKTESEKVHFGIFTNGNENNSKDITPGEVASMIESKENDGWTFMWQVIPWEKLIELKKLS